MGRWFSPVLIAHDATPVPCPSVGQHTEFGLHTAHTAIAKVTAGVLIRASTSIKTPYHTTCPFLLIILNSYPQISITFYYLIALNYRWESCTKTTTGGIKPGYRERHVGSAGRKMRHNGRTFRSPKGLKAAIFRGCRARLTGRVQLSGPSRKFHVN